MIEALPDWVLKRIPLRWVGRIVPREDRELNRRINDIHHLPWYTCVCGQEFGAHEAAPEHFQETPWRIRPVCWKCTNHEDLRALHTLNQFAEVPDNDIRGPTGRTGLSSPIGPRGMTGPFEPNHPKLELLCE